MLQLEDRRVALVLASGNQADNQFTSVGPMWCTQIREAVERDGEAVMRREAAFLEGARRSGALDTLVAHCMVDALRGRPCLLHDDVSGFGEEPLAFCGQVPVAGDMRGVQLPGESDAWTDPPALASRTDGLLLIQG
jgi:hypothetical protein